MRVCMLGVEFEVHEPPELVDALAELQAPDRPRYSSNTMSTNVARESTTPAPARASATPLVQAREAAGRQRRLDVRADA